MRIRVYAEGSRSPIELTGLIPEELCAEIDGDTDFAGELVELTGSDEVAVREWGNGRWSGSFEVTRSHASPEVAALFFLDHPRTVPRKGRIEFLIVNAAMQTAATRTIGSALVKVRAVRLHVCATTMRYEITGGPVVSSLTGGVTRP